MHTVHTYKQRTHLLAQGPTVHLQGTGCALPIAMPSPPRALSTLPGRSTKALAEWRHPVHLKHLLTLQWVHLWEVCRLLFGACLAPFQGTSAGRQRPQGDTPHLTLVHHGEHQHHFYKYHPTVHRWGPGEAQGLLQRP